MMNFYYQKTKENLNTIIKKLKIFKKAINETINETHNILNIFDNNVIYNDNNYEEFKIRFKQYEDLLLSTFDSNIIRDVKENIKNIGYEIDKINEDEINKYNNNFQNLTSLIGLYNSEYERNFELSNIYKSIEEISKSQIKNNINEQLYAERTNYFDYFFYGIHFYSRSKIIFDSKHKDTLLKQLENQLSEKKNKIFVSMIKRKDFIHNYIKSEKFDLIHNKNEFDNFEIIKDIKNFINFIGSKNIDCLGNSLNFNSSFNSRRGNEIYFPPYGWIGIGLKVIGKYDEDNWINDKDKTSEWVTAYHPASSLESIPKIIVEELKPGHSQDKRNERDKRHKGKKVGEGIYTYQDIKTAEEKAPKILFNNKYFKFVFMLKVLNKEIREPESVNYWILNKDFVRIYRILMKNLD